MQQIQKSPTKLAFASRTSGDARDFVSLPIIPRILHTDLRKNGFYRDDVT